MNASTCRCLGCITFTTCENADADDYTPACDACGGEGWVPDESACGDVGHCDPQMPCMACNPDGRDN